MKSIFGKIVDADLTVMNRFERIVYGVALFPVAMAGAFYGMYTLDFVSEASGLATYDSEDNSARWLVVASFTAAFAAYTTFQDSRSPHAPKKGHDLTVVKLGMDRTNRDR